MTGRVLAGAPDIILAEASRATRAEVQPSIRGQSRKPLGLAGIHRCRQAHGLAPSALGVPVHAPDVEIAAERASTGTAGDEIEAAAVRREPGIGFDSGAGKRRRYRRRPARAVAVGGQDAPTGKRL